MKAVAVLVGRLTSTRLPGKQLMDLGGKTSLERHVERLRRVEGLDEIWLATSRQPVNQPLVEAALALGLEVYQGEDEDVVERFVSVAQRSGADLLARCGCDKPFFCHELLQRLIREWNGEDYVYVADETAQCVTNELFRPQALQRVHEHYRGTAIAQYIREHPHKFRIRPVPVDSIYRRPEYRLCLDTPQDLELARAIHAAFPGVEAPSTRDVIVWLDDNPEIARVNSSYIDKNVNEYSKKLIAMPVMRIDLDDSGRYVVTDRRGDRVPHDEFKAIVLQEDRWAKE